MAIRVHSLGALLSSVVLGLVAACLVVWFAPNAAKPAVLLTKCDRDGCMQLDGKPRRIVQMPALNQRRQRAQNQAKFGMLGSVGNNDDENDEGTLFVVGAHTQRQEHPDYWIDEEHDLNGKKLDGESEFAPGWWSKGRAKMSRPYVVWGSRYAGESGSFEHADDVKLAKHGVNVEGYEKDYKGLPMPWIDRTEYDYKHATGYVLPTDASENEKREEESSKQLREAGVLVDGLPLAEPKDKHSSKLVVRKFDGMGDKLVEAKHPCVYKKVDVVGGIQREDPYFDDPNDAHSTEKESQQKLLKAGVNVHGRMHLEDLEAGMRACE